MERLPSLKFITMATTSTSTAATTITFLFFLLTTMSASVLARPHVRPALTLADLDADGTIPKSIFSDLDSMDAMHQLNGNDGGLANRGGGDFAGARGGGRGKLRDVDEGDDEHYPGVHAVLNEVRFDAVDLPSHFETYDLNRDRRVSLNELTIVTGTREIDAMKPFRAADINHDDKISFEEFKNAPWIFGATREVEVVDEFIRELIGDDI